MAAHLSGGRLNIGLLREAARRELLSCLDKCPGSKVNNIYFTFNELNVVSWLHIRLHFDLC